MLHRNRIFKFKTKFVTKAPDGKSEAYAIQIRFVNDPLGILKDPDETKMLQLEYTAKMLENFREVTISYFKNGLRVELLPHQNIDGATIDHCGRESEKYIAKCIENACIRQGRFKGYKFVADSDCAGSVTTVSVVKDV